MSEPNWPAKFNLAQEHCEDVLKGAYDCPVEAKVVLDIGANVGAFARWASQRWPEAAIHCYEPHPFNFSLLKMTEKHYGLARIWPHEMAVGRSSSRMILHENGYNCGEWSLIKFDKKGDKTVEVAVLDAGELPDADFVKIDTEGFEPEILKRLLDTGKLAKVNGLVLEYHAAVHVAVVIWQAQAAGLRLLHVSPHGDHRGILKFIRE